MNIRPRSIPKFQGGNNIWYQGLIDYDPTKYQISYDTSRLVNGDMSDNVFSPWKSNISGYDIGRYQPTNHGAFGKGKEHYNYTLGVEGQDYYKKFGENLLDSNGNFTPTGEAWARAVDALLPAGSNASFYDPKTKQLRTKWTTQYRDAHGRSAQTFTNLKDYVNHVRNDQLLGARHNVFSNKGKRYFYIDNQGQKHWVDPSVIDKYNVSKDPSEQGWEGTTYWDDYELTGLKDPSKTPGTDSSKTGGSITESQKTDPPSIWERLGQGFKKVAPDLIDALRLAGNMYNNERVFNEVNASINPNLQQSYHTYRQIVGDEATKQAYYRRAAQGQTKATQPFTSDADRQIAYMNEAKRIGDELRAQGDLADNQEIRRTSDESNQHQWANKQRDVEVANSNFTELLKAAAARHQLKAQKYSADWTNLEQFLMGKQAKLEQEKAKQKSIQDQIDLLTMQDGIYEDSDYKTAYNNLKALEEKYKTEEGYTDWNNLEIQKAQRALQKAKNKYLINYYRTKSAKSGTKLEYKDNTDKYLYRTSRDIVEHFRKMSKMTDDSRIRTLPKSKKLTSHPKPKKMQLGGVAPFTIYRPLGVGGETAVSSQTSSSGGTSSDKKSDKEKDKLDMIKELFKQVQGLPVDVSRVYQDIMNTLNRAKAYGTELSTDDLASMYLSSMNKMAQLKYSAEAFEKAKAQATSNEALNEIAVTVDGKLVLQNLENGDIKFGTIQDWKDSKGKLNPLTNDQLLDQRAKNPDMTFNDRILGIVNNGVGMNKISAQIKSMAASLGSSGEKIEGISEVESHKIKQGLQILAGTDGTPDGFYKVTNNSKSSIENVKAALNYIYKMLPNNYRTILELHSGGKGQELIANFLASQVNSYVEQSISPLTGKASDKNANGKSNGTGGTDTPASVQFLLGNGYQETVEFNIGNSQSVKALGRFGILQDKDKNNLGQGSNFQEVSKSQFGPILDLDKATFGGTRLVSSGYSHIILNNSDCIGVDLPVKKDLSGNYVPDFQQLSVIEKAEEKIHNNKITNPQQINQIYRELGLPDKFDSNGNIIPQNYRRFAGIQVILDSKALKGGLPINTNEVTEADDEERELFIEEMKKSGNKDYDLSDGILWSSWGRDKLYKGTIFVPVREDIVAGYTSGGYPLDTDIQNNANQVAIMQYAPKTQQYQKTPPLSSLK